MPGLVSQAAMLQSEAVPNIPGLLSNVATLQREAVPTNLNQTNIQPVYDIYASVQDRDLGSVSDDISKIVAELQKELKPGNTIQVLGQIQSMNDSFRDLGIGLLFAAVFVYMLMVVNYQNFGDPFVVILALPATLCGIVTMLFITGTTLSVPSLMGAIMAVGVASGSQSCATTTEIWPPKCGRPMGCARNTTTWPRQAYWKSGSMRPRGAPGSCLRQPTPPSRVESILAIRTRLHQRSRS
jgi:hypothetical protein